jgi:ketol-acid reductoisomerase
MDERRHFQEPDAAPELLQSERVAIFGYGNQGHAHALNLRDGGHDVLIAARKGGRGHARAIADGFEVLSLAEAAAQATVIVLTLPDEVQPHVVQNEILPHWRDDAVLGFAHGFALAFGLVQLPPDRRAFLVAPKGQGHRLRDAYRAGGGLPSLIGVEGPAPDETLKLALAYAHGIGALKGGATLSSFREEAITDQFGEQVVLCGGLVELIVAAWETLVERGYAPEVAYFECLHEVKLIVDLIHAHGIDGMRERISSTAAFGGLKAGPRVVAEESRRVMREVLDEIEDGRFARSFLQEQRGGARWMNEQIGRERTHPIVATGRALREFLERCRLGANAEGND